MHLLQEMFAFPELQQVFTTIAERSDFQLHTSRPAAKVVRGGGGVSATDSSGVTERFDEVVFACDTGGVQTVCSSCVGLF